MLASERAYRFRISMNAEALRALSHEELVALVIAQAQIIPLQSARIAELTALAEI